MSRPLSEPPDWSIDDRPELREARAAAPTQRMRAAAAPAARAYDLEPAERRIAGERAARRAMAKRVMPFGISFLDDALGALLPHDVVLLTARSGAGKTELASMISENAARRGRRVLMIALEAEARELERRIKYRMLVQEFWRGGYSLGDANLSYRDWYMFRLDHVLGPLEDEIDQRFARDIGSNLTTVYRGEEFTEQDLSRVVESTHQDFDMCVLDHLHYVDSDERDENHALKQLTKRIRDLALLVAKPFVVVVHVRKADARAGRFKPLMPTLEDIHGASDVTRMATRAVAIGPAGFDPDKWWMRPTFMKILKDRPGGGLAEYWVAKVDFDARSGSYADQYELGRIGMGKTGEEWFRVTKAPSWAKGCAHLSKQEPLAVVT